MIGDSNAALDWIEAHQPAPALLPTDPAQRLQVRALELAATEALAPWARLGFIGRAKAMDLQPLADHFAAKYGWSPQREASAGKVLRALLDDLTHTLGKRSYLVGDALSRADVTVAAMLATVFGHPADDLFALDAPMRSMFGLPFADDAALAPLRRWRDDLYRRHRGGRVVPSKRLRVTSGDSYDNWRAPLRRRLCWIRLWFSLGQIVVSTFHVFPIT